MYIINFILKNVKIFVLYNHLECFKFKTSFDFLPFWTNRIFHLANLSQILIKYNNFIVLNI